MTKVLAQIKQSVLAVLFFSLSFSALANASIATEVRFSDYLNKHMARILASDKKQIEREWSYLGLAVSGLESYSIPALMEDMLKRGIADAYPQGFDGRIVLQVDELFVKGFPLAKLKSFNTRMKGTIQHFDTEGNLVAEHRISTVLLPRHALNLSRVGPIAREFTADALEAVFPDYKVSEFAFL